MVWTNGKRDLRGNEKDYSKEKNAEVDGVRPKPLWQFVEKRIDDARCLSTVATLLLLLKNVGTSNEKAEVKFVAEEYGSKIKSQISHDTSTSLASTIRLALSVSACFKFWLLFHFILQAYLQSRNKLT